MSESHLILTIPHGDVTATSLSVEGLAHHRSPGSGKHFRGRSIFADLAVDGGKPGFKYLEEGGWRDAQGDSTKALAAVAGGKRTKTALSNGGFSCVPVDAYRACYLIKTGGDVMHLEAPVARATYGNHACHEEMTTEEVAKAVGRPADGAHPPRLYMVIGPIQMILFSNLTPEEYGWYATHRPGKLFRQVMFTELGKEPTGVAASSRFLDARRELMENPGKKTKTIEVEDCFDTVPFEFWAGYGQGSGGLFTGNREGLRMLPLPAVIPHAWDRADG